MADEIPYKYLYHTKIEDSDVAMVSGRNGLRQERQGSQSGSLGDVQERNVLAICM
jgi:hypothetical protein